MEPKFVPEYHFSHCGTAAGGYTVHITQMLPCGGKASAAISLLSLSWSDANSIIEALYSILGSKQIMLEPEDQKRIRLRDLQNRSDSLRKELAKLALEIEALK